MQKAYKNRRIFLKTTSLLSLAAGAGILGLGNPLFATQTSQNTRDSKDSQNIHNPRAPQDSKDSKLQSKGATMQIPQRTLGASGIKVSAIGLGCMGMSANHGPARDIKEMTRLIHKAYDLGYTLFDTAEIYGPHTNEMLVGPAIKPFRDKVALETKFGLYYPFGKQMQDSSKKAIFRAIDGSLKRLQSDYIDIYVQHRVDTDTPIEEVATTMSELIKMGKIRGWGLSEAAAKTIERAHKICPLSVVQSQYSMSFRLPQENDVLKTCQKLGIAFVAYSPLDRGFLTGFMDKNTRFDKATDMRAHFPRLSPEALEANQAVIDFIKNVADSKSVNGKKATIAQISLAWILAQEPFTIPIPETTKTHRLSENLNASLISFSKAELDEINANLSKITIVGDRYAPGSDAAKSVGL